MRNGKYFVSGCEYWYKDDRLHRLDGPAYIDYDGEEDWYKDGHFHREDGPARICNDGSKDYWLNGFRLSKEKWWESISDEMKIKALFNGEGL